jgi:hypothetical protein
MTKAELLAELKKANQLDTARKTPLWSQAFDLYNAANPNHKRSMNCGSCFTKVKNWLQS